MSDESTAVLPAEEDADVAALVAPAVSDGPHCSHCDAPLQEHSEWCLSCGFYPKYNTFVDLDEETEAGEVWENRLGLWVWVCAALNLAVIAAAFAGRLTTPPDSSQRLWWALIQIGVGAGVFFVMHCINYVSAVLGSDDFTVLDFLLKPIALWKTAFDALPTSATRLTMATCGLTAVLTALIVVDGIPWSSFIKDTPPKKKPNLMKQLTGSITSMADKRGGGGADSLEEAIAEFAEAGADNIDLEGDGEGDYDYEGEGEEGEEEEGEDEDKKPKRVFDPESRTQKIDCIVLGFKPIGRYDFQSLIIGAVRGGKLRYVGTLRRGITPTHRGLFNRRLRMFRQARPFVACPVQGDVRWVQPRMTCRVWFEDWDEQGRMINPKFEKLLAEVGP